MKEKIELAILRLFDNPLSKYLILKNNLHAIAILDYLAKLKRLSGASFWCKFFLMDVLYLILYQWTKFQCHTSFVSEDIKHNVLVSSYLDS